MEDVLQEILKNEKFIFAVEALIRKELVKNFKEGGRYGDGPFGGGNTKWKPSKRAVRTGGKTLIDTGNLMGAVGGYIDKEEKSIILHAHNVKYAEKLQKGTKKMPARPFLTLPDSFLQKFVEYFAKYSTENIQSAIIDWLQKTEGIKS